MRPSLQERKEQGTTDTAVHAASSLQHRFHLLDALRGVAALLVMVYHAPPEFGRFVPFRAGFMAVDLFFVLSGFVIAFSYDARLRQGLRFRDFMVARVIRIYPVYLFGTLLAIVVAAAISHVGVKPLTTQVPLALFMLPNLFHGRAAALYPLNFAAWSLLCEMLAYLGYAALAFLRPATGWIYATVTLLSLGYLLHWVHLARTVDGGSTVDTLAAGLARVGYSFFAGVLLLRLFQRRGAAQISGAASTLLAALACVLVIAALTTSLAKAPVAQLLIVTVLFPVTVFLGARAALPGLLTGVASFLGDMSYPLYLIHLPCMALFRGGTMRRFSLHHASQARLLGLLVFAALSFVAWLLARYVDLPVRRLLAALYKAFLKSRAAVEVAA